VRLLPKQAGTAELDTAPVVPIDPEGKPTTALRRDGMNKLEDVQNWRGMKMVGSATDPDQVHAPRA
jgi:hypothetical protein